MTALLAEFASDDALVAATRAMREHGHVRLDRYSPYPIDALDDVIETRTRAIPIVSAIAALVGAAIAFGLQAWTSAIDYPLDIGGRPLVSWPAFMPATVIVALLWGAIGCFVAMLFKTGLPRLHHPIFEVAAFRRLSQERFFLLVEGGDPERIRSELAALNPAAIHEVPA